MTTVKLQKLHVIFKLKMQELKVIQKQDLILRFKKSSLLPNKYLIVFWSIICTVIIFSSKTTLRKQKVQ
jgi:hypothetical protein